MNKTNAQKIAQVKSERPLCPESDNGKHTWIEYGGENKRVCHECDYEERTVIPTT